MRIRLGPFELESKGLFWRVLTRTLAKPRRADIPDWRARPYRILFIRDDGIGDLIISMEAIRAIAEASPTFTLELLASPQNAALARTLPFIKDVIVHRRQGFLRAWPTWRELRRRKYDVCIDGRVAVRNVNKETRALILATGAIWRVGLGNRRNDFVYSVPVDPGYQPHWVDYIVALGRPFGVAGDARDWRPQLPLPQTDRDAAERRWHEFGAGRPRILVNISVGNDERWWPYDKYEPVLMHARERLPDATILISFMPKEKAVAQHIAQLCRGVAEPLGLNEVTGMVATADLIITPDTAITHIASAFETPTLALMRKDTEQWVPYRTPGRSVFGDNDRRLESLPADRVVAALDRCIAEVGAQRGWGTASG